jgi:hypothetical protein
MTTHADLAEVSDHRVVAHWALGEWADRLLEQVGLGVTIVDRHGTVMYSDIATVAPDVIGADSRAWRRVRRSDCVRPLAVRRRRSEYRGGGRQFDACRWQRQHEGGVTGRWHSSLANNIQADALLSQGGSHRVRGGRTAMNSASSNVCSAASMAGSQCRRPVVARADRYGRWVQSSSLNCRC